jgi:putative membrane protein insertion efficiency factor
MKIINKFFIRLIKIYQKYLSVISFGSCRYYPTCSEYAIMQFEFNNFFKALFFSTKRILSCNQFFRGGFDYPTTKCPLSNKSFKKITVKYWLIPKGDRCIIVKNKFKGK